MGLGLDVDGKPPAACVQLIWTRCTGQVTLALGAWPARRPKATPVRCWASLPPQPGCLACASASLASVPTSHTQRPPDIHGALKSDGNHPTQEGGLEAGPLSVDLGVPGTRALLVANCLSPRGTYGREHTPAGDREDHHCSPSFTFNCMSSIYRASLARGHHTAGLRKEASHAGVQWVW